MSDSLKKIKLITECPECPCFDVKHDNCKKNTKIKCCLGEIPCLCPIREINGGNGVVSKISPDAKIRRTL